MTKTGMTTKDMIGMDTTPMASTDQEEMHMAMIVKAMIKMDTIPEV